MNEIAQFHLGSNFIAFLTFVIYFVVLMIIGLSSARSSSEGIGEFYLAGRKLKQFVVALSAVASGRSAWLMLGVSGMAYLHGVSAVWAVVGYILVELFLFLFVGKRLRRFSEEYDIITIPEYFANRYGARTKDKIHRQPEDLLRLVSVLIIIVFMVPYIAAQFSAGGKAFSASFQISEIHGVWVTAGIVLFYTVLGGYLAVSLTDMIQAIIMLAALIILPAIALYDFGGPNLIFQELAANNQSFIDPAAIGLGGIFGFLGIGLGSPGAPHILVRYMSVENPQQLRASALIGTVWNVLMAWGAIYIGLIGRAFYPMKNMLPNADPETVFPHLAQTHLHPILFGLVLAAILSAVMSTADSQLLVAASGVVRDLYEKVLRRNKSVEQTTLVVFSRLSVIVLVLISVYFALSSHQWIFWLVLFAWAGLGAAFGPVLLLSLFWDRTTKWGVIAGMISGTAITILWKSVPALSEVLYELIPAFLGATLISIVVSLLTSPPDEASELVRKTAATYRKKRT